MIRLTDRIKMIFTNQNGETLMEGVVSLLIFSILMMTIAVIIQTSLRITADSITDADSRQVGANVAIFEAYDHATGSTPNLILRDPAHGITVSIPVKVTDGAFFTAFVPE